MPKLLSARAPENAEEERKIRKLPGSRHAPGDWILRSRIISLSWQGLRTAKLAEQLGCHPKTVRKRLHRFNTEGMDGLGDRPGAGRKPRITQDERSPGSSLWSPKTRPDGWYATMAYHRRLLMRGGPPTGPWMPWLRPHKRWVSRSDAAS